MAGYRYSHAFLLIVLIGIIVALNIQIYHDIKSIGPLGTNLLLYTGIGLLLVLVLLAYVKRLLSLSKRPPESGETGFVVDTFHGLVNKLKEKERELEQMRALAEDRASSIESYNENILQSVPSGVVSIDNSLCIVSINRAAEEIIGIRAEDAIGKGFHVIFGEPLASIIAQKKTVERGEYPFTTRDGRRIWIGLTTSPLKDKNEEVIGIILVFTDLTEMKALQAQVELKERLTELGEMSAGIAHELRNPMAVISGYIKLLSKKADLSQRPLVDSILTEIEGMDRIISEFLSFARPTQPLPSAVDLRGIINDACKIIQENIRIDFPVPDNLPEIKGDEVLLRQAFTNIFQNAIDAMPEGGELRIHTKLRDESLELTISDTGHGIPEDIRSKIFLPFFTTKEKGTGLGLALVQKIIVSHGGTIDVESSMGQGTTFSIVLPLYRSSNTGHSET